MMTHYTTLGWQRYGVRPCAYMRHAGERQCTIEVGGLCYTVPRSDVFATAALALEAVHALRDRLAAQQMDYWSRFAKKPIELAYD